MVSSWSDSLPVGMGASNSDVPTGINGVTVGCGPVVVLSPTPNKLLRNLKNLSIRERFSDSVVSAKTALLPVGV